MEWDLGDPPAGSSLTRAVTPAPSQVPCFRASLPQTHAPHPRHTRGCVYLTVLCAGPQTPSVGLLECESNKGADMFLKEMNTFLREMQHMTPTQRFEKTQKALLDM